MTLQIAVVQLFLGRRSSSLDERRARTGRRPAVAELLQAVAQEVAAAVLAQDQLAALEADVVGRMISYVSALAIMPCWGSRLVRERVLPHHGLVPSHREALALATARLAAHSSCVRIPVRRRK